METLLIDLLSSGFLTQNDIETIKTRLNNKTSTLQDIIASLENLKDYSKKYKATSGTSSTAANDSKFNELPQDFFRPIGSTITNTWDNDYTLLNTDKWSVPMQRPPLCINTNPCKVCPNETPDYFINLKNWDESRLVSNTNINKNWALTN